MKRVGKVLDSHSTFNHLRTMGISLFFRKLSHLTCFANCFSNLISCQKRRSKYWHTGMLSGKELDCLPGA